MIPKQKPILQLEELKLTTDAKRYLKETASWSFFLSILGFIGLAFLFVGSFFVKSIYDSFPPQQAVPIDMGTYLTITYFLLSVIFFFPIYYLFQFSRKMKTALKTKDDITIESAFKMLKSHYKFVGVFYIIILSIYLLLILLAIFGVVS